MQTTKQTAVASIVALSEVSNRALGCALAKDFAAQHLLQVLPDCDTPLQAHDAIVDMNADYLRAVFAGASFVSSRAGHDAKQIELTIADYDQSNDCYAINYQVAPSIERCTVTVPAFLPAFCYQAQQNGAPLQARALALAALYEEHAGECPTDLVGRFFEVSH
jgi:hypothetical protein